MIIPTGGVDKALGVHLHRIYRTNAPSADGQVTRGDAVNISKFSALVELGRARAMSLPDVRAGRVEHARQCIELGELAQGEDIASAMINRAVEGKV